ncbi:MAG: hypothetical protein QOI61_2569 [Actinomycetota bacterium]
MRVTFTKKRHGRDFPNWVAQLGKRRIEGSHAGSDPRHLPHDIVTLVVERELGIRDGFFGTVAAGGVFKSMAGIQKPSRRTAIGRNRSAIDAAEHAVNQHWSAWLQGQPTSCRDALDNAYNRWMEVEPGGTLTLDFLDLPAHPARAR